MHLYISNPDTDESGAPFSVLCPNRVPGRLCPNAGPAAAVYVGTGPRLEAVCTWKCSESSPSTTFFKKAKEEVGELSEGLHFFRADWNQDEVSFREFSDGTESPKESWQGRI